MNENDGDLWELCMIGPATITGPNGEQVTINAHLCWIMSPERTLRFSITVHGAPCPILKVVSPNAHNPIAGFAVEAFRDLLGQLPSILVPTG